MIRAAAIALLLLAFPAGAAEFSSLGSGSAGYWRGQELAYLEQWKTLLDCESAPPNDCTELDKAASVAFSSCNEPETLLRPLLFRVLAQRAGLDMTGLTVIDDATLAGYLTKLAPRMETYFELGSDMAVGDDSVTESQEDGYCSECPPGGCLLGNGGYSGPDEERAIGLLVDLYDLCGPDCDSASLRSAITDLVNTPAQKGIGNSLYFNQFLGDAANKLHWSDRQDVCDGASFAGAFTEHNDRFWRFRKEGPREAFAIHYLVHHPALYWSLACHTNTTVRTQARAMWDYQLAAYLLGMGRAGMFVNLHPRNGSSWLWQGEHRVVDFLPWMAMFGRTPKVDLDAIRPHSTSIHLSGILPCSYRPPPQVQWLAGRGELEGWSRLFHNASAANQPHSSWNLDEGPTTPVTVSKTVPLHWYVTPDGAGIMSTAYGQFQEFQGQALGMSIHSPVAQNETVVVTLLQHVTDGDLDDSGAAMSVSAFDEDWMSLYDRAPWQVVGDRGAVSIVLVDPRERACRNTTGGVCTQDRDSNAKIMDCDEADDCVIRSDPRVSIVWPDPAAPTVGGTELVGGLTCDDGGARCTTEGADATNCTQDEDTCNRWRVARIGDVFYGVRPLGEVASNTLEARPARLTIRPDAPGDECDGVNDPPGSGCADVSNEFRRITTASGTPAGWVAAMAHAEHGFTLRSFLEYVEGLTVQFEAEEVFAGNTIMGRGYPYAWTEARDEDGAQICIRLDYWSDEDSRHGTRYQCAGACPCASWATAEFDASSEDHRYGINHGLLAAWHPRDRANPYVSWDGEGGRLLIHHPDGNLVHDWHDLVVEEAGSGILDEDEFAPAVCQATPPPGSSWQDGSTWTDGSTWMD